MSSEDAPDGGMQGSTAGKRTSLSAKATSLETPMPPMGPWPFMRSASCRIMMASYAASSLATATASSPAAVTLRERARANCAGGVD